MAVRMSKRHGHENVRRLAGRSKLELGKTSKLDIFFNYRSANFACFPGKMQQSKQEPWKCQFCLFTTVKTVSNYGSTNFSCFPEAIKMSESITVQILLVFQQQSKQLATMEECTFSNSSSEKLEILNYYDIFPSNDQYAFMLTKFFININKSFFDIFIMRFEKIFKYLFII